MNELSIKAEWDDSFGLTCFDAFQTSLANIRAGADAFLCYHRVEFLWGEAISYRRWTLSNVITAAPTGRMTLAAK